MIGTRGAKSDVVPGTEDVNPIVDGGCPRSVGGIESAKALCRALNLQFELRDLDCQPFLHGYGKKCSDAEVTIGIWDMPITDLSGNSVTIPLYITNGEGFLLIGNEIVHQSYNLGPKNLLIVPPNVREISSNELTFATYNENLFDSDKEIVRTYLHVVPTKTSSFKSYFSSLRTLATVRKNDVAFNQKFANGKIAKRFANKLHGFTHFHVDDMILICQRAGVLNPVLRQALNSAFDKCTSCRQTGKPSQARKVSFSRIFSRFNTHVQVDYMFVSEMDNSPIFHAVDSHTALSATSFVQSREMPHAARAFEVQWINVHGAPEVVSADIEFMNQTFMSALRYFGVRFEPRPARRHNKLGIVERKNAVIRLVVQRLLKDAEYAKNAHQHIACKAEVLSRATYLSNVMYGGKTMSSFEIAKGYTPRLNNLPQRHVPEEIVQAHAEQVARRSLKKLDKSKTPHVVARAKLKKGDEVYYFKRGDKRGKWERGYVRAVEPHVLSVSSRKNHKGQPVRAAYEDIRMIPRNPLLRELDEVGYLFPRSSSILDEDVDEEGRNLEVAPQIVPDSNKSTVREHEAPSEDSLQDKPSDRESALEASRSPPSEELRPGDTQTGNGESHGIDFEADLFTQKDSNILTELDQLELDNLELGDTADEVKMYDLNRDEWISYPSTKALLTTRKAGSINCPLLDIGSEQMQKFDAQLDTAKLPTPLPKTHELSKPHDPELPEKDIGNVEVRAPQQDGHELKSCEQELLKEISSVIKNKDVLERELEWVPRWLLDKAIQKEKDNYRSAFQEVDVASLPRDANIITSHHFFGIKYDGQTEKLKLKCRMVPHGNKDQDKDLIRKDSATAQFPAIRLVFSTAVILGLDIASLDIKSAYLQAGRLSRERPVYVRPPKGWTSSWRTVWKLLKPAYGLVDSGRLWQLAIEEFLREQGLLPVSGIQQVFIQRAVDGEVLLLVAKVVDDMLLAGPRRVIEDFHLRLSQQFKVGRFTIDQDLVFNGLIIHQDEDFAITVNMQEFFDRIMPIDITRERRKQYDHNCTDAEITRFKSLTGSLNFLGHGALPQAAFAASHLQQAVPRLKVCDLVTANKVLQELKSLSPTFKYPAPVDVGNSVYLAFSDASTGKSSYGQTGYLSGMYLPAGGKSVYHVIDWHSGKQTRVSFSSIGAEILAAATSADRGALMAECLQSIHGEEEKVPFVLTVDSNGLYSTITTLHEGSDYRLRPTVARIRDSYENGEISTVQWIPGKKNVADALTKRNIGMFKKLNEVMISGAIPNEMLLTSKRVTFTNQTLERDDEDKTEVVR